MFLDEIFIAQGGRRTYFLTPVAHELFERASHFVHVEVRRPASAPRIFLPCGRMEGEPMRMWECVFMRVPGWVRVTMRRGASVGGS